MRRSTWLAGVGLVLALGPGAGTAMAAGEVRVGTTQLVYDATEPEPVNPVNTVNIRQEGTNFIVSDTSGLTSGNTASGCREVGDGVTVVCPGPNVTSIQALLRSGNDTITLEASVTVAAQILGGSGNDDIRGGSGDDDLRGEAGQDLVRGFAGNDTINTQGSSDPAMQGSAQSDAVNCGIGTDTAIIDNRDGFVDADGNLTASTGDCETVQRPAEPLPPAPAPTPGTGTGGGGQQPSNNQPSVSQIEEGQPTPEFVPPVPSSTACSAATFAGTPGPDRFLGTIGGDRMVGLGGNDLMDGLAGQDCLFGGDGNDTLRGGDGNDRISAGAGNDFGDGGVGSDRIYGSAGVDRLYGRDGNDLVSGGTGSDRLYGLDGNDTLTGSAGNDRLSAGSGRDRIVGGSGRDSVIAGDGNDLIDVRDGSRDVVNCGAGRDTVVRDRRDVLRRCERRASRLPRSSSR